jgi:hypothetical protein
MVVAIMFSPTISTTEIHFTTTNTAGAIKSRHHHPINKVRKLLFPKSIDKVQNFNPNFGLFTNALIMINV